MALSDGDLPVNFIRYLLARSSVLSCSRSLEIPLVQGVEQPQGLADLSTLSPPEMDLRKLADAPTLNLMREVGVL